MSESWKSWLFCTQMDSEAFKLHLQTQFQISRLSNLNLNHRLLFMGSCFSENIGLRMAKLGWQVKINPYGTIYNPFSIAHLIKKLASNETYTEQDLYFDKGIFCSTDHHGSFRHSRAKDLLLKIDTANQETRAFISTADCIFITPGTSFIYMLREENRPVANCHKIPAAEFEKRMLGEQEIVQSFHQMVQYLREIKPDIKIIFTVSPVKHLRDGIVENTASKARLISGLHHFLSVFPDEYVHYFPAYEILTEELRDHRFYAEDLAHPSVWAIEYIFQRFAETFLDEISLQYLPEALKYVRLKNHRVVSKDPADLQNWEEAIQKSLTDLKSKFAAKDWSQVTFEPC